MAVCGDSLTAGTHPDAMDIMSYAEHMSEKGCQAEPMGVLMAAAGAGRDQLIQQLLQRFPQRFALPRQVTDRKPGKGEKDAAADVDFVKPDALAKMVSQGQVVWSSQDAAAGGSTAVTVEAVNTILATGEHAVTVMTKVSSPQCTCRTFSDPRPQRSQHSAYMLLRPYCRYAFVSMQARWQCWMLVQPQQSSSRL